MALSTYAELQASIADHLNRTDLTSVIPDFILMTEKEMERRLRVSEMLTSADITPSSGLAAIPATLVEIQKVVLKSNPRRVLEQVSTAYADEADPFRAGAKGVVYSVEGSNLRITPSDGTQIELTYYRTIPDLATNSTNWLLTKQPGAYLYGSLARAAPYLGDDQRLGLWAKLFEDELRALERSDAMRRYGQINRIPRQVV